MNDFRMCSFFIFFFFFSTNSANVWNNLIEIFFITPWYGLWNGGWFFRQPNPTSAKFCPMNRTKRSYRPMTKQHRWWSESDRINVFVGYHNWFRHELISIRSMSYLGEDERKKISKNAINYLKILMNFEYLNCFSLKFIRNSFNNNMMIRINDDESFDRNPNVVTHVIL